MRTAAVLAVAAALALVAAPARAASGCRSFPRPGTTSAGRAPADLRAEYNV